MGIVETVLAEFDISTGESIRIEDNEGGMIHIHIDNITIGMRPDEFHRFADAVLEANEELMQLKER